ncbi:MAG: hypothetical protein M3Q66_02650 [Chloroflexota bacterium]|nr:hypothetical protein [Chloroflexota bacterium]
MRQDPPPAPHVAPVHTDEGRSSAAILPAAVLVAVIAFSVLGRLVPGDDPADPAAGRDAEASGRSGADGGARRTQLTGPRLLDPVADVLWLRATEIATRGVVGPGVAVVEAVVVADGALLGKATFDVDASGRFQGVVAITPPAERTAARLEVRDPGPTGPPMAEVGFFVEAGSAVLIRDASNLRARPGETTMLDVLVYEPLHEIRALVTSPSGTLIAEATAPATPRDVRINGAPATLMLRIAVPADVRPTLARLHVLGLDRPGHEIAHVDANLRIESRE